MKKNLNISKALVTTITLNAFLVAVVLLASIYGFRHGHFNAESMPNSVNILLIIAIVIVIVNSFIAIRDRYALARTDSRYSSLKGTVIQIENLNNTLRAQRHDFLNQLQVVYSLIEMDEYAEAKDYIEKVYQDIQKVSNFLKTASPAVNALLQAKILTCEKEGIDVEMKVSSQLQDMNIPAWEICRALGNLIDNSIYALKGSKDKKQIRIEIYQDIKCFGFKITNNGPMIEKENLEKIFMPGFTTKGEYGEGMGLSIVLEIVKASEGNIEVQSTPSNTTFELTVPRQKPLSC